MRFVQVERDQFGITVIGGDGNLKRPHGPGLLLVEQGEWSITQRGASIGTHLLATVGAGQGGFMTGSVDIAGYGMIAIVEPHMAVTDHPAVFHYRNLVRHDKPWGYELEVATLGELDIQLKRLHVNAGHRTSLQYHKAKDEVMIHLDGVVQPVPALMHHRVGGDHDFDYFEGSTYHPDDVVRLEDDYGRTT